MARVRMAERITCVLPTFKRGDKVWLEAKNLRVGGEYKKLQSLREGPFEIVNIKGPLTFQLRLPQTWMIHSVFHAALLSPFKQTAVHGPVFAEPPSELIEGEEEYEPEAILQHRKFGRTMKYFIKWKEYPVEHNSWELEESFEHAQELL